jgi:hypothetical protein
MTGVRTPGDVLADLAELEELQAAKTEALKIHRPRTVAGGQVRCVECATYVNGALRRATWPCRTARLMGVDD